MLNFKIKLGPIGKKKTKLHVFENSPTKLIRTLLDILIYPKLTNINGGVLFRKCAKQMDVIVEDDGADHYALAEGDGLGVLAALHKLRTFNHASARICDGTQAVGRVFKRDFLVLAEYKRQNE